MTEQSFDAIVVGSGISGGWAAKELTESGLKVLLLERGENIEHITGYVNALKAPWEVPHRDHLSNMTRKEHPIPLRDGFMHEANASYWVKDHDSPYVEIKPFNWFRGYHVGGRSLMWGRQSYRWNKWDYEANLKEGIGTDWPSQIDLQRCDRPTPSGQPASDSNGNPVQPGRQSDPTRNRPSLAGQNQKSGLERILGVFGVPQCPPTGPKDHRPMSPYQ